jgi:hypothetical protein
MNLTGSDALPHVRLEFSSFFIFSNRGVVEVGKIRKSPLQGRKKQKFTPLSFNRTEK